MKKKVLLKDLVSTGSHTRKQIVSKVIVSEGEYQTGELWDANTIMERMKAKEDGDDSIYEAIVVAHDGILEFMKPTVPYVGPIPDIAPSTVGTEQIQDGSVQLEDLSQEVKDKLNLVVDEDDENVSWGSNS